MRDSKLLDYPLFYYNRDIDTIFAGVYYKWRKETGTQS